jgi:predicted transcriptional regulator
MKALWRLGQGTVREVRQEMSGPRTLAYTTVMTLLDRLTRRGAAARRKEGRSHIYQPLISREAVLEVAVDRLAEDFFEGSRERLRAHLQGSPTDRETAAPEPMPESIDAALL